jgi:hypothetical protein
MWHAWVRREKCTRFWWESPNERDHWDDQGVGGKMGSEWILGGLVWIELDWLRTGFYRHGVSLVSYLVRGSFEESFSYFHCPNSVACLLVY